MKKIYSLLTLAQVKRDEKYERYRLMKKFGLVVLSLAAVSLGACNTFEGVGTKQGVGTVGGAVLGGLAGSQVGGGSGQLWATGAGVLLGGFAR